MPSFRSLRAPLALFVLSAFAHACTYDSSGLENVSCPEDGVRVGSTICVDGVLVEFDSGEPLDTDRPDTEITPDADADGGPGDAGDAGDGGCIETLTLADACASADAQCGSVEVEGNCGMRTFDCDTLDLCGDQTCVDNSCQCVPETPTQFCQRVATSCGTVTAEDNCGNVRVDIGCGTCPPVGDPTRATCSEDTNTCVCVPETDAEICGRLGKQCGTLDVDDNCNTTRAVDCDAALGGCSTGACLVNNTCEVCEPETDSNFCGRLGAECGLLTADDNCGSTRTDIDCTTERNACTAAEVCDDTTKQCICPDPVCDGSEECGSISNACGKTTACGSGCDINADETCNDTTNLCECAPAVCPAGTNCGTFTNACGESVSCGPANCSAGETCSNNICVCEPESDADFCNRQNAACGLASGNDNCNLARTDVDCDIALGGCTAPDACANNACVCVPESDADFCNRQNATCGAATGDDNCGTTRTGVDCDAAVGGCTAPDTCTGNSCACDAESDADFCTRQGAACGLASGNDNCATARTDVDCDIALGGCTAPDACANNACVCVPESDADFCTRQNAKCGLASGDDNCGTTRTDVDCNVAIGCSGGETCNGNSCDSCTPDSDAKVCDTAGAECGVIQVTDNCMATRTIDCDVARGGCSGQVCDANTCEDEIRLQGSPRSNNDRYGASVAVAGDIILVGAPGEDEGATDAGMVYVYERQADGSILELQRLQASDPADSDSFGFSVATDGDTIVVGAPDAQFSGTDSGAAYIFGRSGNTWSQVSKVGPTGAQSGAEFGYSVDVDVDVIAVGEPFGDHGNTDNGALYVFERIMGLWAPTSGTPLTHTNTNNGDLFGVDVEVDSSLGYIYSSAVSDCKGRIAIFHKPLASWVELDLVTHDTSGCGSSDFLGSNFGTSNGIIFGGAQRDDTGGSNRGSVHAFYTSGAWNSVDEITSPDPGAANNDGFGRRIAVFGNKAVITANRDISSRGDSPRVYIGTLSASNPYTFTTSDTDGKSEGGSGDEFGTALAISDEIVLVGRPGHNTDKGSVYIYATE